VEAAGAVRLCTEARCGSSDARAKYPRQQDASRVECAVGERVPAVACTVAALVAVSAAVTQEAAAAAAPAATSVTQEAAAAQRCVRQARLTFTN
jgi:hypothetical protein